jgi:hypothetical protein
MGMHGQGSGIEFPIKGNYSDRRWREMEERPLQRSRTDHSIRFSFVGSSLYR